METDEDGLNAMGRWYRLVHSCDCGSMNPYRWRLDGQGNRLFKVCDDCEERKVREYEEGGTGSPPAGS